MTADREAVAERLAFVAGALNRRLRPGEEGLTHIGLSALASVQRLGAVRPGDLARVEGITAPGTTRLVADLERRGLLQRSTDPEDGRSFLIRLTAAGEAVLAEGRAARAAGVLELLTGLPDDDLAALQRAIGVLEQALLAAAPSPARASV